MRTSLRVWVSSALVLTCVTGCALLWPQRIEDFWRSMKFFENDTLFIVVERQVEYRTTVLGTEDRVHSSTRCYYTLGFRLPKPSGLAELSSIEKVYSKSRRDGQCVPSLYDDQLAPLVSRKKENLFLVENWVDAKQEPAGAIGLKVRRWNGGLWYLVRRKGEADFVTNEDQSVTYTCPPTDIVRPGWECWDVNAGLVLFTESKSLPPYELGYLPPKAYLWYYRENRVETYTIDRVAVDKALRRFIRKQK